MGGWYFFMTPYHFIKFKETCKVANSRKYFFLMKFDEFDWGKLGVEATGIKFHFESLKFRNDLRNKSNHITDFI